jgi:uncharacterized SAM-binding protein YcdF (DUF218 family)
MQIHDLVMVLGSTIENNGALSSIAIERLNAATALITKLESPKIILTGGFGDHFNRTSRAYSLYAQDYLIGNGVPVESIAALVPSLDTVEDATLSVGIVAHLKPERIFIVTSDFHLKRVKYIFEHVFPSEAITFIAAPHTADVDSLNALAAKEDFELSTLKATGKSSLGSPLKA